MAGAYRPGTVMFQSRPQVADMTARPWGTLRATRKAGMNFWYFVCVAGHRNLLNGASVRRAAREHEAGQGTPYMQCPDCKRERSTER